MLPHLWRAREERTPRVVVHFAASRAVLSHYRGVLAVQVVEEGIRRGLIKASQEAGK